MIMTRYLINKNENNNNNRKTNKKGIKKFN